MSAMRTDRAAAVHLVLPAGHRVAGESGLDEGVGGQHLKPGETPGCQGGGRGGRIARFRRQVSGSDCEAGGRRRPSVSPVPIHEHLRRNPVDAGLLDQLGQFPDSQLARLRRFRLPRAAPPGAFGACASPRTFSVESVFDPGREGFATSQLSAVSHQHKSVARARCG
jgi:hypothetical protein